MNYQIDLRSFFLILAAFQSFVFASMLILRGVKNQHYSDTLLAFFLITLSATLSEHIAGWMGWYQSQKLTFFPFGHNFLFAPLAYLYVKSITNVTYRLHGKEWLHFLPAVIYFGIHFSVWSIAVPEKLKLLEVFGNKKYYLVEGAIDLIIISIYSVFAIRHFRLYIQWLPTEFSNLPPVSLHWVRNFLIILAGVCLIEWMFSLSGLYYNTGYDMRYWSYFVRAILLCYLSVAGYTQAQHINKIVFNQSKTEVSKVEQSKSSLDFPIEKIVTHMTNAKPYLNEEFTLGELAQQLNLSAILVSQSINFCLGKNFNDFINEYRVQEICIRLKAGEYKSKTLLGVGLDSGFNSKATFNRAFKKFTGATPKEWLHSQNI